MTEFDGQWLLTSLGSRGTPVDAGFDDITIEISGGQISGNAGVNRFFGKFEDGSVVAPIGSTMMAGPPNLMEQEQKFLDLILRADHWSVEAGSLIASAGEVVAVFVPLPGQLTDAVWVLTDFNDGTGGFRSSVPGVSVTAIFDADGSVSGNAGCNTYRAPYELVDETISIGPAITTRMTCPDREVMAQESRYLEILGLTGRLGFSRERGGEYVELFGGEGLRLARLARSHQQETESNQ